MNTEQSCSHPPTRNYAWVADDATVPSGNVLCVACCECGEVLSIKALPVVKPTAGKRQ